jgi:hypothetical protein
LLRSTSKISTPERASSRAAFRPPKPAPIITTRGFLDTAMSFVKNYLGIFATKKIFLHLSKVRLY